MIHPLTLCYQFWNPSLDLPSLSHLPISKEWSPEPPPLETSNMKFQGRIQDFCIGVQISWGVCVGGGGGGRFVQFDQFYQKFQMKMK